MFQPAVAVSPVQDVTLSPSETKGLSSTRTSGESPVLPNLHDQTAAYHRSNDQNMATPEPSTHNGSLEYNDVSAFHTPSWKSRRTKRASAELQNGSLANTPRTAPSLKTSDQRLLSLREKSSTPDVGSWPRYSTNTVDSGFTTPHYRTDDYCSLLRNELQRMREDHRFFVKFLLQDQRKAISKSSRTISPAGRGAEASTTRRAPPAERSESNIDRRSKTLRTNLKRTMILTTHTSSINRSTSRISFTVTRYKVPDNPLPKDYGYHSRPKNHVTMDCGELKYQYDDEGMEEEGIEDINEAYEDEVDDITTQNRQQELIYKHMGYVSAFLHTAGSSVVEVLRYLSFDPECTDLNYESIAKILNNGSKLTRLASNEEKRVRAIDRLLQIEINLKLSEIFPQERRLYCDGPFRSEIIKSKDPANKAKRPSWTQGDALDTYINLDCLVCYRHECLEHGKLTVENDESVLHRFSGPSYERLVGAIEDLSGESRSSASLLSSSPSIFPKILESYNSVGLDDNELEPCSEECHRNLKLPTKLFFDKPRDWTRGEEDLVSIAVAVYGCDKKHRWACVLADLVGRRCVEVFRKGNDLPKQSGYHSPAQHKKPRTMTHLEMKEKTYTGSHLERPGFTPCSHAGPCVAGSCSCFDANIACEKTCFCSQECYRRFRGCSCRRNSKTIKDICWQNNRCECFDLNRECDPDLCLGCCCRELLDPLNRQNAAGRRGRCNNISLQKGDRKRLIMGTSELEGNGAFVAEPGEAHEFVGEYTGEIVTEQESQRRGRVYDARGQSYIFTINQDFAVDASTFGTKVRFINHSQVRDNCAPKVLFVNGTHRVGIWLKSPVKAGEELFMNYGEEFIQATRNLRDFPQEQAAKLAAGSRTTLARTTHKSSIRKKALPKPQIISDPISSSSDTESSPYGLRSSRRNRAQLKNEHHNALDSLGVSVDSGISSEEASDEAIRKPSRRRRRLYT